MLRLRLGVLATCVFASLASPLAAAPIALTKADGSTFDTAGEVTGNSAGFVAGWLRLRTTPAVQIEFQARQFSPAGAAMGKPLRFDSQPYALFDPTVLPTGSGKVTAIWLRPGSGVFARAGNTTTGVLGPEKRLLAGAEGPAEANIDAIRLDGGRYMVLSYRFDMQPPNFNKRLAATIVNADLSVARTAQFLPGPKAAYTATAASDFTAAPLNGGGAVVAYRNRADGNVYVVNIGASGAVASSARKLNVLAMPLGSGGQQADFKVDAVRLKSGKVVVAWTRVGSTNRDDAFDVQYRLLTSAGLPTGSERRAHASSLEEQLSPDLAALPTGGFALAWTNNGGPVAGRPRSYLARRFTDSGAAATAAKTLYKGERGLDSLYGELATAGSSLLLVHSHGTVPSILEGFRFAP